MIKRTDLDKDSDSSAWIFVWRLAWILMCRAACVLDAVPYHRSTYLSLALGIHSKNVRRKLRPNTVAHPSPKANAADR